MYSQELENLIDLTLKDGVLSDKEREVLFKRAEKEGVDLDEFEIYLNAREFDEQEAAKKSSCPSDTGTDSMELTELQSFLTQEDVMLDFKNEQGSFNAFKLAFTSNFVKVYERKFSIICNASIPTTREGLLGMIAYAKPKADKNGSKKGWKGNGHDDNTTEDLSFAYWTLFESCVGIAKANFQNDPAFQQYFDFYEKESQKKSGLFSKLFG